MRRKLGFEMILDGLVDDHAMPPQDKLREACAGLNAILINEQSKRLGLSPLSKSSLVEMQFMGLLWFIEGLNNRNGKSSAIYKIAEQFGKHLAKTDLDLPCAVIPHKAGTSYWIEFPDNVEFKTKYKYTNCLVTAVDPIHSVQKAPWFYILALDLDEVGNSASTFSHFSFALDCEKISDLLKTKNTPLTGSLAYTQDDIFPDEMIDYVLKCLVYIESGEPDLHREKGSVPLTKKPKKLRRHYEEFCPFDIVNVGYAFHERTRHVSETMVSGFFRWQRYGTGFTKVKLIWVNEFPRKFKLKSSPLEQSMHSIPDQATGISLS